MPYINWEPPVWMDFTYKSLFMGMAQYLADVGVGVYNEAEIYAPRDVGICLSKVPLTPDRVISLFPLQTFDNEQDAVRRIRVQLRIRGTVKVFSADDLADKAFAALNDQHHLVWNGIEIARILRLSALPMGADANTRWEQSDTYEIITQRRSVT